MVISSDLDDKRLGIDPSQANPPAACTQQFDIDASLRESLREQVQVKVMNYLLVSMRSRFPIFRRSASISGKRSFSFCISGVTGLTRLVSVRF